MIIGIVGRRRLDHARQLRRFRQRDLAQVFAQVRLRRFAEPVDAEGPARAQINLVGVILENLFLGKPLLDLEGDDHFRQLARPALALVEPEIARQLHAERGRPLFLTARFQIDISRFDDAQRVEAGMLEEMLVFRRGDGLAPARWEYR